MYDGNRGSALLSDGGLGDRVFLVTKWANRLHSFSSAPENLARGAHGSHLHHHETGIRAVLDARASFGLSPSRPPSGHRHSSFRVPVGPIWASRPLQRPTDCPLV